MSVTEEGAGHVVAVIGGACAGSVVAGALADAGCRVVVFEQNARPYGKIEDGLPRWHDKQRKQEYDRIDARLKRPEVEFVPATKLGRDVDFTDLATAWGFSLVVLCNGAWKDRELASPTAREALGRGFAYQNAFVYWFNHKEEPGYQGPRFEVSDGALVIGGGLASIDVLKIIQLELYAAALRARGLAPDVLEMEHQGIPRYLARLGIEDPKSLGIEGCVLLYRRRPGDMPLASLGPEASEAQRQRLPQIREKILGNAQAKFLFRVQSQRLPRHLQVDDGRVTGLVVQETRITPEGDAVAIEGSEHVMPARLVVSSIGSIPEPIAGVEMSGVYYKFKDAEHGEYAGLPHVYGAGNVVTGQGNIKASVEHGEQVAAHLVERYAMGDRPHALAAGEAAGADVAQAALQTLSTKAPLTAAEVSSVLGRVHARQQAAGYDGDYAGWIRRSWPEGSEGA